MQSKYSQCLEELTKSHKNHYILGTHQGDILKFNHLTPDTLPSRNLNNRKIEVN